VLLIRCPWCGERDEIEFSYGGQAHIAYPSDPASVPDGNWAKFLFLRENPKGWFKERWLHAHGCRRWFNAIRHTVTHQIAGTYKPGEAPPAEGGS